MKVLILANFDVGLYQFRKELLEELIKREYEVYVSVPNGDLIDKIKDIGCKVILTDVDRRGVNPIRDFALIRKYNSLIKEVKPDLVITYTIKPNVYGGLVCRMKKTPYAVNITGLGTAFQKRGALRSFVKLLYKTGLKKARVIFFENEENRQIFIKEKIIKEEKTCLLNGAGVNVEKYYLSGYPDDNSVTKFLFMGRVMKEKGVDELFKAMRRLHLEKVTCELIMLGGYEEDYKSIIDKYSQEGWLKYFGYQEDVKPFIEQSHCFVLPSWHEGMANTNLECASMGRPVITSNIHGCLEAVEDGVSGFLCEKQNADDLYKVMKKFIALSYEERKAMGTAGRKRMEEIFDKKDIVEKTISRLF